MNTEHIPKNMYLDTSRKVVKFDSEVSEVKYSEKWLRLFPAPPGGDFLRYRMTDVGLYSVSLPHITEDLMCLLMDLCARLRKSSSDIVITETNGGLGGWSPALMNVFKFVNVVEIHPLHAEIIEHNISVITSKQNRAVINADYMDVLYNIEQDIIVSDPPWGGPGYRGKRYVRLGFNNVNIVHVINQLYAKNRFKFYVLLAMVNFDLQDFMDKLVAKRVFIHKIMGYDNPHQKKRGRAYKHYFVVVFGKDVV